MYAYRYDEELPDEIEGHAVVGYWDAAEGRDGYLYPIFGSWLVTGHSYCWDATCSSDNVHVAGDRFGDEMKFWRFCTDCQSEQEMGTPDPEWECAHCGVNRGPHAVGCGPLNWPQWGPGALARAREGSRPTIGDPA